MMEEGFKKVKNWWWLISQGAQQYRVPALFLKKTQQHHVPISYRRAQWGLLLSKHAQYCTLEVYKVYVKEKLCEVDSLPSTCVQAVP